MLSAPILFQMMMQNVAGFFSDIATNLTLKAIVTIVIAAGTYLIGADNLQVFLALMALVGIEFVMRVISFISKASPAERLHAIIEALEVYSFSTAVQFVTYGMLASAAHLTDEVVLGNHFFAGIVISFLAVSQLLRIIKCASGMGYSFPVSFISWLEAFRDGRLEARQSEK